MTDDTTARTKKLAYPLAFGLGLWALFGGNETAPSGTPPPPPPPPPPPGTISFSVVVFDANTNAPIVGAAVHYGSHLAITDANGITQFLGVEIGPQTLTASAFQGYQPYTQTGFNPQNGGAYQIPLAPIVSGGPFGGFHVLVTLGGQPIPGLIVQITDYINRSIVFTGQTNAQGVYDTGLTIPQLSGNFIIALLSNPNISVVHTWVANADVNILLAG